MSDDALTLAEAVPLGYAVLAQVAEDAGVRMLAIKGPVLALQGLRPPRQSVDIDVLVDPQGFARLGTELEAIGWRDSSIRGTPTLVPQHSATHRSPHWPCEVDVHHWFPGFLADPQVTFDLLWKRRGSARIADRDIPALDQIGHGALAALHYLRDEGQGTRAIELDALCVVMQTAWTSAQRNDLLHLAAATGSSDSLAPLLRRLGLDPIPSAVPLAVTVHDWRLRSESRVTEVLPWLVELSRLPWRRRPVFIVKSLWPVGSQLRDVDPAHPPRGRALLNMRIARLRRACRVLPEALRDQRRLRGGGR